MDCTASQESRTRACATRRLFLRAKWKEMFLQFQLWATMKKADRPERCQIQADLLLKTGNYID